MKFRVVVRLVTVPFYFSEDSRNKSEDTLNCPLDLQHRALHRRRAGAVSVGHPRACCLSEIPEGNSPRVSLDAGQGQRLKPRCGDQAPGVPVSRALPKAESVPTGNIDTGELWFWSLVVYYRGNVDSTFENKF